MIKVDLITGFLGSGKTTFLLGYARYLMSQGLKIGILEYDYGAVNVDMMLLGELRGPQCELEMVAAGCDADCLRRRFKTKLIAMGMSGYDRVLIEPSGVFDMDEFFDTLRDEPLDRFYEIGSVLTIVNAKLENNTSSEADFMLASQAVDAGMVVLSRTQLSTEQEIADTEAHIAAAAAGIGCNRDFTDRFYIKDWNAFTDEDYKALSECGYRVSDYVKKRGDREFESVCLLRVPVTLDGLKKKSAELFSDKSFGDVFRVKGFVFDAGVCYQFNATPEETLVTPIRNGQAVIIIIGLGLDRAKITAFMEKV